MEQLTQIWTSLDMRRRIMVIAATLVMFLAILGMSRIASTPTMALLYSELDEMAAGDVVNALDQRNLEYQVRGQSIYVEASQRDRLRMSLAAEGLPANNSKGYELLDSLNGFGTTSRMFDAAYWRAKEGELARTIAASPSIASARVHIARTPDGPFRRDQEPSASVTLKPAGAGISDNHARSLTFLVASSVAGLVPDRVTVMDETGMLLGMAAGNEASGMTSNQSETLRSSILRLLEARVGSGNAVVEVSLDVVTEREQITERLVDPDSLIAISTDTEERKSESSGSSAAGVTVASNLPDGDAASNGGDSRDQDSESRERVNYEFSETQREITRIPGAIKRISVAILVNHQVVLDGQGGSTYEARPEEELNDLQELVASAVGLDTQRGDRITIKSMPFELVEPAGETVTSGDANGLPFDVTSISKLGLLSLVTVLLGIFVIRPLLMQQKRPEESVNAISGVVEYDSSSSSAELVDQASPPALAEPEPSDPMERFRELIGDRQDESIQILQSWLEEKAEKV